MQQYRATILRNNERIHHCIFAVDRPAAKEKLQRAYPNGHMRILTLQMLKNMRPSRDVEFSTVRG